MSKFTKIGIGFIHESKKGNKSIHFILDPTAQQQMLNHDFERGMFVFKSDYKKNDKPYYSIMAPMPDNYKYQSGRDFDERKKEIEETLL